MTRRTFVAHALALAFVLAFTACHRAAEPPKEQPPAPRPPAEKPAIRLGYLRIGSDLPYFVGAEQGVFARHGLDVKAQRFAETNEVMDAVTHGQIDATDLIGSSVVLAEAAASPGSLKIFMVSEATESTNIHQLIARKGSGIRKIEDLKGRKLAVFKGTQMRAYASLFLGKHLSEADAAKVELVPLSPPQQVEAMETGSVDAVLALEPTGTQLVALGKGDLVASNVLFENITKPRPFVTAFGIMRSAWAQEHPRDAEALVAAYREIAESIAADPDGARDIMAKALELDPAVAKSVSLYRYSVAPALDAGSIQQTADLMLAHAVLTQAPDVASVLWH